MATLDITILGLSITSSWGNGHATTYRGLVRSLAARGHRVTFLERDVPWYADNRDLANPPGCQTELYDSLDELRGRFSTTIREADVVVVGSYVPDGIAVGKWVQESAENLTAFYDIDTPITLARLAEDDCEYLSPDLVSQYDLYLSFSGGKSLQRLEREFHSPLARPLYCSVDPEHYYPLETEQRYDLGYLGTYSTDRQPPLEKLLIEPASQYPQGRFVVAGPQYPDTIRWPPNVERIDHLPPAEHCRFYNSQRFTLNVTRAEMIRAGHSPSVRLFEAAACGTPIISDWWAGLDELFEPDREILIGKSSAEVLRLLQRIDATEAAAIGHAARERVLADHTADRRAEQFEQFVEEANQKRSQSRVPKRIS
ncbi:CgeB family protein [Candidatus Laterigemmans baculatus]|uniref:CgeB family protein n=1 Tax=Candidatus Laterigemmans baculatus TaxID=2770505 RepID=UPI0013DCF5A5|nr:glycosyltransferase [Candidatus Laterigemmans baculatus]